MAYTLLHPTNTVVVNDPSGEVTFAQPAPANSYLKFAAIGVHSGQLRWREDVCAAQKPPMDASMYHEEHFTNYLTPVPAGVKSVMFKMTGWLVRTGPGARFQYYQPVRIAHEDEAPDRRLARR